MASNRDDEILYSKNNKSIISDFDKDKYSDSNTQKLVELPKSLLMSVKNTKHQIESKSGRWINESKIFRVGARLVLEGVSMLNVEYIHSEEELLEELRKLFNLAQD